MDRDYIIIGGGVVGLSVAWGLLKRGCKVLVLDGDDGSFRASRGNFGLVWVQGKGLDYPAYARWSQRSAFEWTGLASELGEATGRDLSLQQNGGYDFYFSEESLQQAVSKYEKLKQVLGGDYPYEVLGPKALKAEEPNIGPKVAGATLHYQDGHVNPLRLLQALADDVRRMGGEVHNGKTVIDVSCSDGFTVSCSDDTQWRSEKVVLSAGLGSIDLIPKLGFTSTITPERGQLLITEKLPKLMNRPAGSVRQVDEGGVQIGASNEAVGFDDHTTVRTCASLAAQAIDIYPQLARAQVVRSWAALRILSPDGYPIYERSALMPGAFLVTCHSGITLAAAHARFLPEWLEQSEAAPDLEDFSEKRFTVY